MRFVLLRLLLCCAAGLLASPRGRTAAASAGLPVSRTLGGCAFDPWNTVKWAAWYDGEGRLARSFVLDVPVTFAMGADGGPVTWKPVLQGAGALFEIVADRPIDVDGRGTTIDVTSLKMAGSLEAFYGATALPPEGGRPALLEADWSPAQTAFYLRQERAALAEGAPPSHLRAFRLRGFHRGVQTHHAHRRRFVLEDATLERCLIAVFARGSGGEVRRCTIRESFNCGVYGEYGSRDWTFSACDFRDNSVNGQAQSYGDIVLDACYDYRIEACRFHRAGVPDAAVPRHRTALSLYRNSGETGDIREHATHDIAIEGNTFAGYRLAVDIAARAGVVDVKDRSLEGCCYTHDIAVRGNRFEDCSIAIKSNGDRNRFEENAFVACGRDIVVQCVFYRILGQYVVQREAGAARVWLWSRPEDTAAFADACHYQSQSKGRVYGEIADRERLFQIVTEGAVEVLPPPRADFTATVWRKPSLVLGASLQDMVASGATPIDIAVANFADHLPGDEIAVIWDAPVSRVRGTDYYSIVLYDCRGMEIDRCGRSRVRWRAIAGGDLLPGKGFIHVDAEAEIVAAPDGPNEKGRLPLHVFRRGFALSDAEVAAGNVVRLAADNTEPWLDLAVGEFAAGNRFREVAALSASAASAAPSASSSSAAPGAGARRLRFFDATRPDREAVRASALREPLVALAAGDFDPKTPGDEVAGIEAPHAAPAPIRLYRPGTAVGAFAAIAGSEEAWSGLAGGNFDGDPSNGDEVAAGCATARDGVFGIAYFRPAAGLFKHYDGRELGVAARTLDAGTVAVGPRLLPEERADDLSAGDAARAQADTIKSWGEHVFVLPRTAQGAGIPLFLVNRETDGPGRHRRTVPLYR